MSGHIYYDLVRNYRQSGKVKHERLTYVGKLPNFTISERRQLVRRVESLLLYQFVDTESNSKIDEVAYQIVGKLLYKKRVSHLCLPSRLSSVSGGRISSLAPELSIQLSSLKSESHRNVGAEWLCYQVIKELGLLAYLEEDLGWSHQECHLLTLALLGRLVHRGSERSTASWLSTESGSQELQNMSVVVHRESLRKISVLLSGSISKVSSFVYERIERILMDLGSIESHSTQYYYDLSNVYFEGRMLGSELAQYGRSKEKRHNQPLVSYGLLTDERGFIQKSSIYSGNISEPSTFQEQLIGVNKDHILFCDAGIATRENIIYLLTNQYRYMCVARESFAQFSIDFEDVDAFEHTCSNGQRYQVWLKSEQHELTIDAKKHTEYLLFVKSEGKQIKEDGILHKQKERFEKGLLAIRASLTKPRGHKSIAQVHQRIGRLKQKNAKTHRAFALKLTDDGKNVTAIDWNYQPKYEQRNGLYIIRTSEPIKDLKATWNTYNALTTIEEINRSCKTDLRIRPIYHQKDTNIKAHLNLTFLAANIVRFIRWRLAQKGIHHSWDKILQIMTQQKSNIITFSNSNKQWIWVCNWTDPNPEIQQIYDAFKYEYKAHEGFFFLTEPK